MSAITNPDGRTGVRGWYPNEYGLMLPIAAIATLDFLTASAYTVVAVATRDHINPWPYLITTIVYALLAIGLLCRWNAARLIRTALSILAIAASGFLGFWLPYAPFLFGRPIQPEDFTFPFAEALTIVYSVFVIWILTRPNTVRLFKRK